VILLDRLLAGGIGFVLGKVAEAVDAELDDERLLQEELLAAQLQLEMGEMEEAEFAEIERDLLARLRRIRDERRSGEAVTIDADHRIVGVDVTFDGGHGGQGGRTSGGSDRE
jgi:hypothetical protein